MDQIKDNIFNPPLKQLSQLDSVNNILSGMQSKIDSLEKIVIKTEIGTGFFSDVISTNLYVYTAIISLTALLSWGWLTNSLRIHKKLIEDKLNLKMDIFQNDISALKKNLNKTVFHTNRAMYWNAITHDVEDVIKFNWALSTVNSYQECIQVDNDELEFWLEKALLHILLVNEEVFIESKNNAEIQAFLQLNLNQESARKIWSKVRAQIYLKLSNTTESPTMT